MTTSQSVRESWEDTQEFYELMQAYRHTPITEQKLVSIGFEAIKNRIALEREKAREEGRQEGWTIDEKIEARRLAIIGERQRLKERVGKMRAEMKVKHICRFNDGGETCDCYLTALDQVLTLLSEEKE